MKKHFFPILSFPLLLFAACTMAPSTRTGVAQVELRSSQADAIAQTRQGKVAGYVDNGVYIFKGVPYAKAERFMPPEEPDAWEGVRSCRAYGPTSPQIERANWRIDEQAYVFQWDDGYPGEDCQRINIWTPGLADGRCRPVMVWLHGGGFSGGSGQEMPSYDGTNLARRGDVVVVTLNHRLNVLGFLDLSAYGEKYKYSGNVGLLDLIAAFQWVKQNIAAFGGDPQNVTIFGQSGGGGKVSTLLATPAARGLFHKAIVQSGSLLRTMETKYSRRIGVATVEELGLTASRIDELQQIPYKRLLVAGNRAVDRIRKEAVREGVYPFIFGWAPTVDGDILPAQPWDPQAPEQSRDIPMIVGTTLHEFTMSIFVPILRGGSQDVIDAFLNQKYGDRANDFRSAYAQAYPEHNLQDLVDIDGIFRPYAIEQVRHKALQGGTPVYNYLLTYESPAIDGIFRSVHCLEIPFVFDNAQRHAQMTGGGPRAQAIADRMSNAWINFARTGDPNSTGNEQGSADNGLPEWEPYTLEGGATMIFDDSCRLVHHHDKALLELLKGFPAPSF